MIFVPCTSATAAVELYSAMEYRRCQPLCSRFIASDDPHSKCVTVCTGHSSAHEQGCQRLSFVVDDAAPLRPFRHPNTGMFSRPQHSAPSITFVSQMGASTRGIVLGSPWALEAPGHSCTQLPGWLAHSGPLQEITELSQGCCPPPRSCSWSQNEHQEECFLPLSTNCVFGSSLGFRSNTGQSGSCPDFQPQCMFGPLHARTSCLCEHLSQALRPHGLSLICAAPGVTPHEAVPLVDKASKAPLHKTSRSPNHCVAQLLSHPFNMAKPPFSSEWSQNGRDSPSPNGYDGRIPDRLGRGLRGQENSSLGT